MTSFALSPRSPILGSSPSVTLTSSTAQNVLYVLLEGDEEVSMFVTNAENEENSISRMLKPKEGSVPEINVGSISSKARQPSWRKCVNLRRRRSARGLLNPGIQAGGMAVMRMTTRWIIPGHITINLRNDPDPSTSLHKLIPTHVEKTTLAERWLRQLGTQADHKAPHHQQRWNPRIHSRNDLND